MREKALENRFLLCYNSTSVGGLLLPMDWHPEEEAVGLILLYISIISLLPSYCKDFLGKYEFF